MRIVTHLTTGAFLLAGALIAAPADAQTHPTAVVATALTHSDRDREALDAPVDLEVEGVPLAEALVRLQEESAVAIAYSPSLIPEDHLVSCDCADTSVKSAIRTLLRGTDLELAVLSGQLLIRERQEMTTEFVNAEEPVPAPTNAALAPAPAGTAQSTASRRIAVEGAVSGRVIEEGTGRPLQGAQVELVGLDRGTLTGSDGTFTLSGVPAGEVTVRVQLLGYAPREETVTVASGETADVEIVLAQQALALDEVVAIGTPGGTQRRAIGNVVERMDAASLREVSPATNTQDLLGSRLPGVSVVPGAGQVGASGAPIRIRGSSSAALGNDPIVYIDGIRMNADPTAGWTSRHGTQNRLNDLNPEDIESIEVIKGPAAATLYGTEASSGVIQIITKRGAEGATTFDVSSQVGSTWLHDPEGTIPDAYWRNPDTGELITHNIYRSERERPDGFGELFQYGLLQDHNISARGGTETVRYYASLRRQDEEGVVPWNTNENISARASVDVHATENLNIALNASYYSGHTRREGETWMNIYWSTPATNSSVGGREDRRRGFYNRPLEDHRDHHRMETGVDRTSWSAELRYDPFDWLSNRLVFGVDVTDDTNTQLYLLHPDRAAGPFGQNSRGRKDVYRNENRHRTFDYAVTARFDLTDQWGSATSGGFQYFGREEHNTFARGDQLPSRSVTTVEGAAENRGSESFIENVTVGAYIQQEFDYNQRLFLTGAVRMDDNSAFGAEFDAAVYPKLSATWVLHEEDFWRWDRVSSFRVRSAFGAAGQQPDVFDAARLYRAETGPGDVPVLTPDAFGNPDLSPERGEELELGFDAGFLQDRVHMEFTQYFRNTRDAIVARPMYPSSGFPGSQLLNVGEVRNWGTEIQTDFIAIESDVLRWDLGVGFATMRNEIRDLGEEVDFLNAGFDRKHMPGYSLSAWFHRKVLSAEFVEGNSGPVTNLMCDGGSGADGRRMGGEAVPCDDAPAVFWGHTEPTWEASLSSNLQWQNWQLFASIDGRGGHIVMDNGANASHTSFQTTRASWEQDDPIYMAYREIGRSPIGFHDGDFFKLREVSLRYMIPDQLIERLGASRASVNVAARNVATLWMKQDTHNLGGMSVMDPEMGRPGLSFQGEHQAGWPPLKHATVTFRFSF